MVVEQDQDGRLGERAKRLLLATLDRLQAEDVAGAVENFTILSADHGGDHGNAQWMVALRHLVRMVEEDLGGNEQHEQPITAPL